MPSARAGQRPVSAPHGAAFPRDVAYRISRWSRACSADLIDLIHLLTLGDSHREKSAFALRLGIGSSSCRGTRKRRRRQAIQRDRMERTGQCVTPRSTRVLPATRSSCLTARTFPRGTVPTVDDRRQRDRLLARTTSITRKTGDCQLHIEFSHVPATGEPGRGNSGVFLMDTYELQILDSYENKTYFDGQAGAIYRSRRRRRSARCVRRASGTPAIIWTAPRFQ